MKTFMTCVVIILTFVTYSFPVTGAETDEAHDAWRANYEALEDEKMESLLQSAGELLSEARTLPEDLDIYDRKERGPEETESGDSEEDEGWVKLVDPPAVPRARFARMCEKAGRYEHAAELYSELIKKHPGQKHYQKMWFICRRLSGDKLDAIRAEMEERGMEAPEQSWLEWAKEVDHLSSSLQQGEKQ